MEYVRCVLCGNMCVSGWNTFWQYLLSAFASNLRTLFDFFDPDSIEVLQ